jgi:O-antigen/teichoic acid export membrane protein
MIKEKTVYFSFIGKLLSKFFFLFITIFSLKLSNELYASLIIFFVLANYFYELVSISIPKLFNNYYRFFGSKKLSILAGINFYISFLLLCISFVFLIFNQHLLIKIFEANRLEIYYAVIILGFSIFLNELINQYVFIKLNHLYIYLYDISSIIVVFIISFFIFIIFDFSIKENIYLFILYYASIELFFKLIKFLVFKSDITFNINKIYFNINLSDIKNILKLITPILIVSLLILTQLNIGRFITLYFESISSFVKFVFHIQVIELCSIFFAVIHQLTDPKFAILIRKQNMFKLKLLRNKLFNIYIFAPPLILIFIFFLINDLILILGINIKIELNLYIILSINFYLIHLFFSIYQYIIMINARKFLIKVIFISLFLNFIFSIVLIKLFSIFGLAIAITISNLFLFLICNKHTNFFYFRKKDLKKILFSISKILFIIIYLILYNYFFSFENIYLVLMTKIIYAIILFAVSELIFYNLSLINNLNSFTRFVLHKK